MKQGSEKYISELTARKDICVGIIESFYKDDFFTSASVIDRIKNNDEYEDSKTSTLIGSDGIEKYSQIVSEANLKKIVERTIKNFETCGLVTKVIDPNLIKKIREKLITGNVYTSTSELKELFSERVQEDTLKSIRKKYIDEDQIDETFVDIKSLAIVDQVHPVAIQITNVIERQINKNMAQSLSSEEINKINQKQIPKPKNEDAKSRLERLEKNKLIMAEQKKRNDYLQMKESADVIKELEEVACTRIRDILAFTQIEKNDLRKCILDLRKFLENDNKLDDNEQYRISLEVKKAYEIVRR